MTSRYDSLNYSKWDHIGDSSSDGEEKVARPRVTRLDRPSTITTVKDGSVQIVEQPPPVTRATDPIEKTRNDSSVIHPTTDIIIPPSWIEKGATVVRDGMKYFWSQDRLTVTLRFLLDANESKFKCWLTHPVAYKDRFNSALEKQELFIQECSGDESSRQATAFGQLEHVVHLAEDEDEIDWSIEHHNTVGRYLSVVFYKATPMSGLVLWWKRFVVVDQEIDLTWVADTGFADAWKEAHEQFRCNVREKHTV